MRGLTDNNLEKKFSLIKEVAEEGIFTTKEASAICGYKSTPSFITYVLHPLMEKKKIKKIGGGVFKIIEGE